eukprot:5258592-Pyramimonas_sp.AAC.1
MGCTDANRGIHYVAAKGLRGLPRQRGDCCMLGSARFANALGSCESSTLLGEIQSVTAEGSLQFQGQRPGRVLIALRTQRAHDLR